jgi:phosphonate transport system substrate-binding protein
MHTRHLIAASLFAAALAPATHAAADWRADHPEIVFGMASGENLTDQQRRWQPLADYLSETLRVEVTLRQSNEYAAIIEAQRAGQVDLASYGSAAYATAYDVLEGNVVPLATDQSVDGQFGYFSMLVTRNDDAIRSLDDLKGKKLAYIEPNSTSGYLAPHHYLAAAGYDDAFFSEVSFAGADESALLAVGNGTYDATVSWYNSEDVNNLVVLEEKGMVPAGTLKILWKTPVLPNGPFVVRADMPADMQADIKQALLDFSTNDPDRFATVSAGKWADMVEVSHDDYLGIIAMRRDALKR